MGIATEALHDLGVGHRRRVEVGVPLQAELRHLLRQPREHLEAAASHLAILGVHQRHAQEAPLDRPELLPDCPLKVTELKVSPP